MIHTARMYIENTCASKLSISAVVYIHSGQCMCTDILGKYLQCHGPNYFLSLI